MIKVKKVKNLIEMKKESIKLRITLYDYIKKYGHCNENSLAYKIIITNTQYKQKYD